MAHCRQELHATINSIVVSRCTRLDSFVVNHIAFFLCTTNLEAFSTLYSSYTHVHLSFNSPIRRPHPFTHSTPLFSTPAFSVIPLKTAVMSSCVLNHVTQKSCFAVDLDTVRYFSDRGVSLSRLHSLNEKFIMIRRNRLA